MKAGRRAKAPAGPADLSGDPIATAGRWILAVKILAVIVAFDPAADDVFALPKVLVSRAFALLLVAALAGLAVRYGRRVWHWSPLYAPVAAYVMLCALAVPMALDRTLAVWGAPIRQLGLANVVDDLITVVAAAVLVRTAYDRRLVARVLFASSVPVLVYAGMQWARADPISWSERRLDSTFGNPAHLGAFLAIVATTAVAVLALSWRDLRRWERGSLIALAVASSVVVAGTASRAPVLALVAGLAATVVLTIVARRRGSLPLLLGVAGLLVALVLVSVFTGIASRFAALISAGDPPREVIWGVAARLIGAHPILGIGPDNFAAGYPALRPARSLEIVGPFTLDTSAHSWLLQAALSAGLPGLVADVAAVAMALGTAIRRSATTAYGGPVAAGIVTFLAQAVVAPDQVTLLFLLWLAIGVLAGAEPPVGAAPKAQRPRSARITWGPPEIAAAALVAIALAVGITGWSALAASRASALAVAAGNAGDGRTAVAYGRDAVRLDGGRATYWAALGRGQLQTDDAIGALASFQRAASLAPYLSGHWRNVASVELAMAASDPAHLTRAAAAARRATEAEPVDPFAHEILAHVLLEQGDRDGAIREAQRAIDLWPSVTSAYEIVGVAYAQQTRYADAERVLTRGLEHGESGTLHLLLARVYLAQGSDRTEDAREELARAVMTEPDSHDVLQVAASLPPIGRANAASRNPPKLDQVRTDDCANTPRACMRISFRSPAGIRLDDRPGSALRVAAYGVNGQPLPQGTRISIVHALQIIVTLPAGTVLPGTSSLEIRDVTDLVGRPLDPDPTTVTVP